MSANGDLFQCPICSAILPEGSTNVDLNQHIDVCLNMSFIEQEDPQPQQPQPQLHPPPPSQINVPPHFFPPPQQQQQPPQSPYYFQAPPLPPQNQPLPNPFQNQPPFPNQPLPNPFQNQPPLPNQPLPNPPSSNDIRCEVCGKQFPTFSRYFSHKGQDHPSAPHNPGYPGGDSPGRMHDLDFECPVCGERFANYDDFHAHMSTSPCKDTLGRSTEDEEGLPDLPVLFPQELTGDYHSFTLETIMTGECGICYEEFELKQMVARLDCLCLYHQMCIKKWYKSSGEKRCPMHGDDYTKSKW